MLDASIGKDESSATEGHGEKVDVAGEESAGVESDARGRWLL